MQIPFRFQPTPKQAKDQILTNKKTQPISVESSYFYYLKFLFGQRITLQFLQVQCNLCIRILIIVQLSVQVFVVTNQIH